MVQVPSSGFTMGNHSLDTVDEMQHQVYLDSFFVGVYEVTNREYAAYLSDSGGELHWDYRMEILRSGSHFQAISGREDFPVNYVSWGGASAYCSWTGGRLPTEAEWEKAARGAGDVRIYPWGDQVSGGTQANFANPDSGLWRVGVATGLSPYGCRDMSGNVWEWTADWFDADYYTQSPDVNPTGPSIGEEKTIRGGSFMDDELSVRCSRRESVPPNARFINLGFRCVRDSLET